MAGEKKPGIFQESDGSFSFRRVAAFVCLIASIATGAYALQFATAGWFVFIPCVALLGASIIFVFFTTWESISAIAAAWKGKQ